MNPVPNSQGLKLNISENDNALDIDLVLSVAPCFRIDASEAFDTMERGVGVVRQWRKLAPAFSQAV
jgi:serine/threonine-protein kinase HipA